MGRNPIECLTAHAPHLIDAFNKTKGTREDAVDLALKEHEKLFNDLEQFKKDIDKRYTKKTYTPIDNSEKIKSIHAEYDEKINAERDKANQQSQLEAKEKSESTKPVIKEGKGTGGGKKPPVGGEKVTEDGGYGITHAQTEEIRKNAGLPEYEKEAETFAKWDAEAKQRISDGEMPKLIERLKRGEMPSDVEQRMMGMYVSEKASNAEKDPSNENLDALHEAVKLSDSIGGSQIAKSLVARKGTFLPDESLAGYFERERMVNNDAPLTEQQKLTVQGEWDAIEKAKNEFNKYVFEKESEISAKQVQAAIESAKRTSTKKTTQQYSEERKQIISSIKDKLKKARSQTQATIVPYAKELIEIAPDVLKLVKNLVGDGITRLEEVVDRVHELLSEDIKGVQKNDIIDLIAGKYTEKKPTKNQLAKDLFELKQQAKLINRLESLYRGEEPKNEKRKVQRNQEIEKLRNQIKDIEGFDREVEKAKEAALTAKAEKASKIEKDLMKAEKEPDKKTPYQKAIEAYKTRTSKEINRVDEQIRKGDYSKEEKKQPIKLDEEGRKLKDRLIKLKTQREIRIMRQQYENRNRFEKTKDWVIDKMNVPRTIMSSMDYSAPLRQGLVAGISHPRTALKASLEMFKASFSQKNFDRWVYEMRENPNYDIKVKSGLSVTDPHSPFLAAKEEAFMNNTAEKIPIIGKLIKGSERAYVMFLNKMRSDLFDRFMERFEEQGKTYDNSPELYKAVAKLINAETGRGDLGKALENAAPILNTVFFSPRLIASRVNLLTNWANPYWYKNTPREVRVMYMKDMLKFIGLGMTVLAIAKYGGNSDVEDDPRSSDFGKIKSGNTRWDIWGGFQQYIRLITQMATGEKKSMRTGEIQELDSKGRFGEGRGDVIGRFLRGKLAPVPSMAVDFFKGRTVSGEDVTLGSEAESHLLPLIYSDVKDAMKDKGVSSLFTVGIPAIFGVGVQTFTPTKQSQGNTLTINGREDNTLKYFSDKGMKFSDLTPSEVSTKEVNGKDVEFLSDYSPETQKLYSDTWMVNFRNELAELYGKQIFKDADGTVHAADEVEDGGTPVNIKDLTPEEMNYLGRTPKKAATEKTKEQVLKNAVKPKK